MAAYFEAGAQIALSQTLKFVFVQLHLLFLPKINNKNLNLLLGKENLGCSVDDWVNLYERTGVNLCERYSFSCRDIYKQIIKQFPAF